MGGSTAFMAPAVKPSTPPTSFSRSHSTPELLSLASLDRSAATSSSSKHQKHKQRRSSEDKRLPSLPTFDLPSFNSDFELDTSIFSHDKDFLSNKAPIAIGPVPTAPVVVPVATPTAAPARTWAPAPGPASAPAPAEDTSDKPARLTARLRTASLIERPRSWMPNLKATREPPDEQRQTQRPATSAGDNAFASEPSEEPSEYTNSRPLERSLTASQTFASFAKRSWMSSSRSPSPKPKSRPESPVERLGGRDRAANQKPTKRARTPNGLQIPTDQAEAKRSFNSLKATPKAFTRASTYLSKIKHKQPATLTKPGVYPDSNTSHASSVASLAHPPSNSNDTCTSQSTCSDDNATTPITDDSSNETAPRMRDTLWSSFKTLEVEFKGFYSKHTGQRIVQVQSLILPFLRSTMNHASNKGLRPEDVDRRATILNRWWIAILDMLEGHGQQPVPGVDRPILLEAATMIMMRSEWRQTTTSFSPLADRSPTERVRSRSWTNMSESTHSSNQSAMLAESAEHNVRTMFVSNLIKQMALVVDKMSLRHAPLTLINFAGKTCAYAFFFAPGVADILIRLWGLTPDVIRRASDEFGLPRKDKGESEDIVSFFPPKLGVFGWSSPRAMWQTLKQIPKMTLVVARIPWTGPWVSRWKGRDTDLFFIFCKYFHVLSDQFQPPGLPLTEKARSPAFVLVQAQLLSILDTTIHRQTAIEGAYGPPLIDPMHGADASAMAMPLPPSNLMKGMSENRLVILLRDFLTDDSPDVAGARHTFAESFAGMLKAATCKTSQYNTAACFTLCDFLEEVFMVYNEFEAQDGSTRYIDWNFWFEVCQRILNSLNTMSEVRMLSFIFAIWDAIAKDPRMKAKLCLDWLLTEDTFNSLFNNWCPMVRAYYQRLLCWRICRDAGSANEMDTNIFLVAATRLKTVWAHYLFLKQDATESGRVPPSTAPMSPTLGKKFMIIRQEVNTPQPGLFMGFDSFARTPSSDMISGNEFTDAALLAKGDNKKRWSLLGKVLSLTSGGNLSGDGYPRGASSDDQLQIARQGMSESRARSGAPLPPPKMFKFGASSTNASEPDSTCSSPLFEEQRYSFKFFLGWQQPAMPARERVLARPRLPGPAQSRVRIRARNGSPPPQAARQPTAMRTVSGSPQLGLVHEARNASPLNSPLLDEGRRRSSTGFSRTLDDAFERPSLDGGDYFSDPITTGAFMTPEAPAEATEPVMEPVTQPVKPVGIYQKTAVYSGRALAEWEQVVNESNIFIDRRRDEGVLGLSEVEVPLLGVEGFRKPTG